MIATRVPGRRPRRASACASALERSCTSRERERAALVDQREVVRVARRGGLVAGGGRRAPADQRDGGVEEAVGALRADDPDAGERRDGLQLAGDLRGARSFHAAHYPTVTGSFSPGGALARLDQAVDVGRAARVEEHVALADRRLLGEQPVGEQRLADRLGELALVAGEAAREVREVRVVAAPLAHAVEPLEDPPRDAPRRVGVLVRGDAAAVAVRLRAARRRRPRAPRPSAGRRAGRRAARPPRRSAAGGRRRSARAARRRRARRRAARARVARRRSMPRGVLVEGERDELGVELAPPGTRDDEEAVELAGAHADRGRVGGRPARRARRARRRRRRRAATRARRPLRVGAQRGVAGVAASSRSPSCAIATSTGAS